MTTALPSALDEFDAIAARLRGQAVAMFLDYDGTLADIAPRPEQAELSPSMRDAVARLAESIPVAVISGRALADVQAKVDLPQLFYAGSHGFDIAGPEHLRYQPDERLPELFAALTEALRPSLEQVPGVVIESKVFSIAVHYRLSPAERVPEIEAAVDRAVASHSDLRKTFGKKLFEIRPKLDWHKGRALLWLLEHLGDDHVPVFIGDDRTDEDALAVVATRGIGIFVGEPEWETAATYRLGDTHDVERFLTRFSPVARAE